MIVVAVGEQGEGGEGEVVVAAAAAAVVEAAGICTHTPTDHSPRRRADGSAAELLRMKNTARLCGAGTGIQSACGRG